MRNRKEFKTFRRRRSLRLQDFDYAQPYVCYHVIIGTYEAQRQFVDPDFNETVLAVLREIADKFGYAVIAFCLMPDHLHLLVQAKDGCQSLERFIGAFKSVTARLYWQHKRKGKLWQRGFYEHIVRRDEDLTTIADYILSNPARMGLVDDPEHYPWAGQWDEPVI